MDVDTRAMQDRLAEIRRELGNLSDFKEFAASSDTDYFLASLRQDSLFRERNAIELLLEDN